MSAVAVLKIGSTCFAFKKPDDAAKVMSLLLKAMPIEESWDREASAARIRVLVDKSYCHQVVIESHHESEFTTEPRTVRIPKSHRLEGIPS